jgi:hypothetical protein
MRFRLAIHQTAAVDAPTTTAVSKKLIVVTAESPNIAPKPIAAAMRGFHTVGFMPKLATAVALVFGLPA